MQPVTQALENRNFSMIFDPPGLPDYKDYFTTILSLAGVLLGLAFAALLYVIQNGMQSFTYSRRMFIEIYATFAKVLLGGLSYIVIISLAVLYLRSISWSYSWIYYIYAVLYTKAYLDFNKHQGYIKTIFSSKFVPASYGPFRSYFRYIFNLGLLGCGRIILILFIFVGYPVCVSKIQHNSFGLTEKALFYSTLLIIAYSVIRIANFITEFFYLSKEEIESGKNLNNNEESDENCKEKSVLRKFLLSHGIEEIEPFSEITFCGGMIWTEFLENSKSPEAWFNIYVEPKKATVFQIRSEVCKYAHKMLILFAKSMVDINSFVLSFHISLKNENKTRNIFFRVSRSELKDIIVSNEFDSEKAIDMIKNKLFDDLFCGPEQV